MQKRYLNLLIVIFVLALCRFVHDPIITPAPAAEEEVFSRHPTTAMADRTVVKEFEKTALVSGDWVGSFFQGGPSSIDAAPSTATTQPTAELRWVIHSTRIERLPLLYTDSGGTRPNPQEQMIMLTAATPTNPGGVGQPPLLSSGGGGGGSSESSVGGDGPSGPTLSAAPTNAPIDAPVNALPPINKTEPTTPGPVGDVTTLPPTALPPPPPPLDDDITFVSELPPTSTSPGGLGSTPPTPAVPEPTLILLPLVPLLLVQRGFRRR